MGLLNKIFGNDDTKDTTQNSFDWKDLTEINQLEEIVRISSSKPVFIFKHSTRCAISRMALKQFERDYNLKDSEAEGYFVDLLEHRDISNAIAERFGITHQSPQLLLIKDGRCVYSVTHSDINAEELSNRINKA